MVDEKLDDQVWVTVVATGYGDGRRAGAPRASTSRPGELQVSARAARRARARESRRGGLAVGELEVPEFIPNV